METVELLQESIWVLDNFLILSFGFGVRMVLGNRLLERWVVGHFIVGGKNLCYKIGCNNSKLAFD